MKNDIINVEVYKFKPHPFSKEVFEDLSDEDYTALKNDIQKNGVRIPVEALPDFTLIDGHQRLKIAKEIGLATLPCIIKNLSEAEAKQWIITANLLRRHLNPEQRAIAIAKLSKLYEVGRGTNPRDEHGQWTENANSASSDVLERVAKITGLSPRTIATYRTYANVIEEYPQFKGKPIVATLNEAKRLENIQVRKETIKDMPDLPNLICGDALQALSSVPDKTVDVLLIDPPYGIGFRSNHPLIDNINKSLMGDDISIFGYLDKLFDALQSKLKDDAFVYVFTSWKVIAKLMPIMEKYFDVKNVIVWDKGNWTGGDLYNNYADSYELIVFASKGNKKLNWMKRPRNIISCTRPTTNPRRRLHPVEKPVDLLKQLISHSTVEGEVVLDCFAGSGSTLVAAEELNRKWIGIEIDPEWYEIAKTRILERRKNAFTASSITRRKDGNDE